MTEQEAEALVARLVKIWAPLRWDSEHLPALASPFCYQTTFETQLRLVVQDEVVHSSFYLDDLDEGIALFTANTREGLIDMSEFFPTDDGKRIFANATIQYLSFFRRGCWLSGCAIEASAHEKMEWMRGFNSEELDAWNLKM